MRNPSWEELNAYVDGELDRAHAAEIADAAAGDPRLAGQIAQLMRAKSGVSLAAEAVAPESLRVFLQGRERTSGWQALRRQAMAASFLVALFGAGLYLQQQSIEQPGWFAEAQALHTSFAAQEQVSALPAMPATAFALEGKFVLLPDLAAGELTLVGLQTLTRETGELNGVAAHYRGNRGCQVTLIALPYAPEAIEAEAPVPARKGDLNSLVWRDGDAGYLLLGSGMDPARFKLLADKVQAAAKDMRLFTPDEELALAKSRAQSKPCAA